MPCGEAYGNGIICDLSDTHELINLEVMSKNGHNIKDDDTIIFGSRQMREPAPTEFIPKHRTPAETAYQIVKDETFPQTQPRLNLATFVTTYMDDYGTRLMNESVGINFIDETEYPRIAVMCGRCINMIANMWNTPEKAEWKTGAVSMAPLARTPQG